MTPLRLVASLAFLVTCLQAEGAQPRYRGLTVESALRSLEDSSLQFLYSNELVPETLIVRNEPRTRDRLGIAREILAEHGLEIRSATPSLYVVVRSRGERHARFVRGEVVDAHTGLALTGARVELAPLGRVSWSDEAGRFSFDELEPGASYILSASIRDYANGEAPLRLASDDDTPRTIRLQRVALDTVVVEASRYAIAGTAEGALRVEGVDLATRPEVAEDPIRALRHLPGVMQGGLSAASNLRGGETNEVLVLLDGFPLRQLFHLPGYQSPFSVLDEDLVGSIEAFTGGFPARYGNRLAGVFDIRSTDAGDAPRNSVGLSFFNARARMAGESDDASSDWRAAARVGTLRPVLQYLSVDSGRPSYSDVSLSASHRTDGALALHGNLLFATDEYVIHDDDEQAEIASRTRYSWLRADYAPRPELDTSVWIGSSSIDIDRVGFVDKPEFSVGGVNDQRRATFWDLRANLTWQRSDVSRLNAGFEYTRGDADYRYDSEVTFAEPLAELFSRDAQMSRSLRLSPRQTRAALFVSQRWRIHDRWVPEVGARVQRFRIDGLPDQTTWDPRLGLRFELQPRTGLRLHWGRFHQSDEVHELALPDGVSTFARAQRSEHLIVGLEHRFTTGVELRAEVFRKQQAHVRARFENLLSPIEVLAELAPDRFAIAPDRAWSRGFELSAALERENWRAWGAVSAARAVDVFAGNEVPRSWDQRFALTTGLDWHRGQWRVGGVATVRSGWPTTPVNIDAEGDAVLGARNSARMPTFASLDFRVEYRRPLAIGSLAVALDVSNLTNRRNQCCVDVEVEDPGTDEEAIIVERQDWPRLLPSLSVKWEL
jgi:outer membrane cobalamin receptor